MALSFSLSFHFALATTYDLLFRLSHHARMRGCSRVSIFGDQAHPLSCHSPSSPPHLSFRANPFNLLLNVFEPLCCLDLRPWPLSCQRNLLVSLRGVSPCLQLCFCLTPESGKRCNCQLRRRRLLGVHTSGTFISGEEPRGFGLEKTHTIANWLLK